jgi:hypothetical protein
MRIVTLLVIITAILLSFAPWVDCSQVTTFQSPVSPLPSPTVAYTPWPTPGWEALMPLPRPTSTPTEIVNNPASEHHADPSSSLPEVPEVPTLLLMGAGLVTVWGVFRRKD